MAGATFSAAAVAAGLAHEVVEVEDWCAGLARRQQWLEACGEQHWPDGTVAGGTGSCTRSTRRWRTTGCRPRGGCSSIAALASGWKRAMGPRRGSGPPSWPCTLRAGRTPSGPCGICSRRARTPSSARPMSRRPALHHRAGAARHAPRDPGAPQHELDLQIALGPALIATKGQAAPEVEQTYARARRCASRWGDPPALHGAAGLMAVPFQPGGVPDGAGAGGAALTWRSASTTRAPPGGPRCARESPCSNLGEYAAARTTGAGACPLTPRRSRPWPSALAGPGVLCLAIRPTRCGAGLSGAGRAAESGGADPGPGAGTSL